MILVLRLRLQKVIIMNPKGIFGSYDPKYYDQIITAGEEYERSIMQHLLQNQKIQGEGLHNQTRRSRKMRRTLLVIIR
jgi:hypothetical protein